MAHKIIKLIENKELRLKMGESALRAKVIIFRRKRNEKMDIPLFSNLNKMYIIIKK